MKPLAVPLAALVALSLGCGKEEGRAKRAGQSFGETMTDFAHGVGSGIDNRLQVEVELSPGVVDLGLSKTVAKSAGIDDTKKGIAVYFISQKPVNGNLVAKAMNADGEEIGRSVVEVEFSADDAKYVTFRFDKEMDSQLVARYVIDARPTPEAEDRSQ